MNEEDEVCGFGFPIAACVLTPGHEGLHNQVPVTTTGEFVAYGIDKVTYGDVVNGKTRYVDAPEEESQQP